MTPAGSRGLPDAADGRTSRAQQRRQNEDHPHQQESQSQHQMRLHHRPGAEGHSGTPAPEAGAAAPATPPAAPRDADPDRLKKNLARSCTADGSAASVAPPAAGVATAAASETTGAWETSTVSTPYCHSRLARRPLSLDREQSEERGDRPRDRERSRGRRGGSRDREPPDERGNAYADDAIGSGQKTATGHAESGIDPRIETGLPENQSARAESNPKITTTRGRTATEKMTASDALDLLTANGKRSESEDDGHGHESCPTESELYDPSVFLALKNGKRGRIEQGSGPPKLLSTHHVAQRAAMSRGEATEEAARAGGVCRK